VRDPRTPLLVLASLTVLVSACRGRGFEPTVRRSMSTEARCPEDKIQVKGLTGGVYQAEGCGKTATYDCWWPEGGTRECTRRGAAPEARMPGTDWRWP